MTSVQAAPERSLTQRLDALEKGNRIRTYRAQLKKDLKRGRTTLPAVLERSLEDEQLHTMKLFDLLLATPKIGRIKANTIIRRARISPSKTLAGLTGRQRHELELALGPLARRT